MCLASLRAQFSIYENAHGDICICKAIDFDSFPAKRSIYFGLSVCVCTPATTEESPKQASFGVAESRSLVYNSLIVNLNVPP